MTDRRLEELEESGQPGNTKLSPTEFKRAEAPDKKPLVTISPVMLALLALFIVLAGVALFMFNARSVKFNTYPESADISITSGFPVYPLGGRYLMLAGEYTILAAHPGYAELTDSIRVSEAPEQTFDFSLTRLPGMLNLTSAPVAGAEVYIDQTPVGVTPLSLDAVAAGHHSLSIKHPRYLPYQTDIDIEGMRVQQEVAVTLSPAWARVTVHSIPTGAILLIDGTETEVTPAILELLKGKHDLVLKKAGYMTWHTELSIVPQKDIRLPDVLLIKTEGQLSLSTEPEGANITISGKYYGQTPLAISLPPRADYELVATKAGYQQVRHQLKIESEQEQQLHLSLEANVGMLYLKVSPPGGTLFVNGKKQGMANQTLELPARRHQLRVELPGFVPWETAVTLQPGLAQELNVLLQTEAEAKIAAIPQQLSSFLGDKLRFILPGKMKMGADRREPGRRSNEIEKDILLTRAYYLGETEISNKSFRAFDAGHDSGKLSRALLNEDDRPAVNVSWDQAAQFCNWLSKKDGLRPAYEQKNGRWQLRQPTTTGYRLPTESEWSWAARYATGGPPTRFPWGHAMPPSAGSGNFADKSAANMVSQHIVNYNDNYRGPAPSGTFAANALGIFDLAGNVSEWVHDYYSVEIYRKTLSDPVGPARGDYHVIRGSNYTQGRFSELRWTFRDYGAEPRPDVGFRIARYAE